MPSKQLYFYATSPDILEVIATLEAEQPIKYYQAGLRRPDETKVYSSLLHVGIGEVDAGENNYCPGYIILPENVAVQLRTVPQYNGETKVAIDQKLNPSSIYFRPCGKYSRGQAIIEGSLGTISTDPLSIDLFKTFSKHIRSRFVKIEKAFVGKNAMHFLQLGWRLTQNLQSPRASDIQLL